MKTPPGFRPRLLSAFAAISAELDFSVDEINLLCVRSFARGSFQDCVYSGIYYPALSIAAHNGYDFQLSAPFDIPLFHIVGLKQNPAQSDSVQSREGSGRSSRDRKTPAPLRSRL